MSEITVVNLSGTELTNKSPYNKVRTWKGELTCVGDNRFVIISGNNIIALVDMDDMSRDFDMYNRHAVTATATQTLFIFEHGGCVVVGKDVFCISAENISCHHNESVEIAMIRNYMLDDYQIQSAKALSVTDAAVFEYFKKK